jgi:hypothetical protein
MFIMVTSLQLHQGESKDSYRREIDRPQTEPDLGTCTEVPREENTLARFLQPWPISW